MHWIDALDTKAGILLGAGGLIAGLLITAESPLQAAPAWLAVTTSMLLLGSIGIGLVAFAVRRYETAPNLQSLVSMIDLGDREYLEWVALPEVLKALDINEAKVSAKATLLFYGQTALLAALLLFGGYHVVRYLT